MIFICSIFSWPHHAFLLEQSVDRVIGGDDVRTFGVKPDVSSVNIVDIVLSRSSPIFSLCMYANEKEKCVQGPAFF